MPAPCNCDTGPCGVDSVATCQSCGRRACNKHMVMAATSIFGTLKALDTGVFRPVQLSHPSGESFEDIGQTLAAVYVAAGWASAAITGVRPVGPSNPGFVAFASGGARCYRCRVRDGAAAVGTSPTSGA